MSILIILMMECMILKWSIEGHISNAMCFPFVYTEVLVNLLNSVVTLNPFCGPQGQREGHTVGADLASRQLPKSRKQLRHPTAAGNTLHYMSFNVLIKICFLLFVSEVKES